MCLMIKGIIPAISDFKRLEKFIASPINVCVLLNFRLAQLEDICKTLKAHHKKVLIHGELIKGLSNDEDGALYLIQSLGVDGIISSKPKVIELCKKRNVIGIYRFFLKDSLSYEQSIKIIKAIKPQYIEVLPYQGCNKIRALNEIVPSQYLSGGLIDSQAEVDYCMQQGAIAVTTSKMSLW